MGGEAGADNCGHGRGLAMLTLLKLTSSDTARFSPGGHVPFLATAPERGQRPIRIVPKHIGIRCRGRWGPCGRKHTPSNPRRHSGGAGLVPRV